MKRKHRCRDFASSLMPSVVSSLEKEGDRVKERAIQAQAVHYRRLCGTGQAASGRKARRKRSRCDLTRWSGRVLVRVCVYMCEFARVNFSIYKRICQLVPSCVSLCVCPFVSAGYMRNRIYGPHRWQVQSVLLPSPYSCHQVSQLTRNQVNSVELRYREGCRGPSRE